MEQGRRFSLDDLEPPTPTRWPLLRKHLDAQAKDWARFGRQADEFHLRNARAWANAKTGLDLADQIDPEFVYGAAHHMTVPFGHRKPSPSPPRSHHPR